MSRPAANRPPSFMSRKELAWELSISESTVDELVRRGVTAVIRLRQEGLSTGQIGDIVGMSLSTITRYCRYADRKSGGKAALIKMSDHKQRKMT